MTMRRRRATLLSLILFISLVGACGLWLRTQQWQYALNRLLIAALVQGDDKQALALVEAGADPNTRYQPTPVPSLLERVIQLLYRWTPSPNDSPTAFMIACGTPCNDDEVTGKAHPYRPDAPQLVVAMLRHGAKVNAQDKDGGTPLEAAVNDNRSNTVEVLLEHGADANAKDGNRWTPLMLAHQSNIMRLLLQHGAEVNVKSKDGWTPLTLAEDSPAARDFLRLLLQHGADVNVQGGDGTTPLYRAVVFSVMHSVMHLPDSAVKEVIRQLLAHRADPNLPIKDGDTPLQLAEVSNRVDLTALLGHGGAKK